MKKWILIGLFVIILTAVVSTLLIDSTENSALSVNIIEVLSGDKASAEFERAIQPRRFRFPADMGPHNRFQTEWWYFTGNLDSPSGREFGYQLTFFRRAIRGESATGQSKWRTNQLYMAHFAISDIGSDRFLSFERFSRGSAGLAGASGDPFHVWLENWDVSQTEAETWELNARTEHTALNLTLNLLKPMILNGKDGFSQKGSGKGDASYYFSNTRLASNGTLRIAGEEFVVSGDSWLDKEWSTSVLSREQVGWDWFSMQLNDRQEIMLFQIRESSGGISEYSSGSFIDPQGQKEHLKREAFTISVLDHWRSPVSGKRYPSAWQIRIPSKNLDLTITPMMSDQEHRHSFSYWEGAVRVSGEGVSGRGYVELTGYSP